MLNIMETFPLGQKDWGFASTNALHTMIEAKKLAYADLLKYIGDSRKQKLPVATLLSKEWAGQRAKQIDVDHAKCDATAGEVAAGNDTTYLTVVDREGNMVSLIQSNYELFGSGIVAPGTGFALHDRGGLFSLDPASPNEKSPPRSTFLARSRIAERPCGKETSPAHDHPGVRPEGRFARGIWNHGGMEPVASTRESPFWRSEEHTA